MKRYLVILLLVLIGFSGMAQTSQSSEQFPVFPDCESKKGKDLENCFYSQVRDFAFTNFKIPEKLQQENYKGTVIVLFEVNAEGNFNTLYVDAADVTLSDEAKRVFATFPKIGPPTYNGTPYYSKYTFRIAIPLQSSAMVEAEQQQNKIAESKNYTKNKDKELIEYDSIVYHKFNEPKFESHLNIPFSHSFYAQFDDAMNQVGANNHTASKPYTYAEVSKYYNLREANEKLLKSKTSWGGRKLWNENLVQIQGEGYWFTMNPILDLQLGYATGRKSENTFTNTRGIKIDGGLGEQITFSTTIFETQARFANYYNDYSRSIRATGSFDPAIVPGIGIAKSFKTDAFDLPSADANISYTPSKIFNIQLGYGRNFIGDGYRSLITTDGISPYPYFKLNTSFWKIKYTNTYMFLKDVRAEVTEERTYATKFMANHYLSWNASKRLNIGFFESVIWANTNGRGFDASFLNPIIFYRSVEFTSSARSGNALLGLTAKYKVNNQINLYGQFLLDEFSLGDIKGGEQSWKNKFGYQLGAKYFNAFNIENLLLQVEYNHVRPYVYAHSDPLTNYGHSNQSLGHQWGGNFKEVIAIARYHNGRYFADAKVTIGKRGLDFNSATDSLNYGGNIYRDYEVARAKDIGVKVGQGNTTKVFIADIQAGYLINPATNLKVFASYIFRNFDPREDVIAASADKMSTFKETTSWISLGVRCDIFNWYFDY